MSDRPILFNAPMVRALLSGTKTQTRRLCKWANNPLSPQLTYIVACDEPGWFGDEEGEVKFRVPFVVGDRLWVREQWHAARSLDSTRPSAIPRDADIEHAATARSYAEIGLKGKVRPGMFMPRWTSRLTLIITDVHVERLQDISEADAIAEGVENHAGSDGPISEYALLWDSINGHGAWDKNPWVVAVSFDVILQNIDQVLP